MKNKKVFLSVLGITTNFLGWTVHSLVSQGIIGSLCLCVKPKVNFCLKIYLIFPKYIAVYVVLIIGVPCTILAPWRHLFKTVKHSTDIVYLLALFNVNNSIALNVNCAIAPTTVPFVQWAETNIIHINHVCKRFSLSLSLSLSPFPLCHSTMHILG